MLHARDIVLANRLDGVSAAFAPGWITAICGPNGAGKSSLLSVLAGLVTPEEGSVAIERDAIAAMAARQRARTIGYLPQSPEIAWDVSVETLVELGRLPWRGGPLARRHGDASDDAAAIEAALDAMELHQLRERPLSRLSGGERSRALMARVLAGQPEWILADEPLANLDIAHQLALLRLLRREADAGRGIILVMHDLSLAMNYADEVLVLESGRRATMGPPRDALSDDVVRRVWGVDARWHGSIPDASLSFAALKDDG
ncbi:ABC transporter ATP-binding protein [Pseudoblastomonas halimionae]|uniref:ATP-binding cassette domain-containing protein n=1 Tax=Alteriqipengyuania halimionae TaxID=1926630 RepID=A0A6I4U1G6_9SPHN|nr:ABC transporter ATP-binding protein [Alteriqipengyuania halimionae]MXP09840.1 ATP-binding cassette domain-containing protein [Alteriqipengyuania halimionae]